ncbi:unnamed protein product, partial [Prorocentrum cordatum]
PRRLDAAVGPRGLSCLASDQEHIDINVAAPRRASVAVLAQYLRASDPPPISKARPGVGSVASVGPCNSDAAASCFRTGILSSRCDQRHRPPGARQSPIAQVQACCEAHGVHPVRPSIPDGQEQPNRLLRSGHARVRHGLAPPPSALHQARRQGVQEDRGGLRHGLRHHGLHRVHCEVGLHPDKQHHRGRLLRPRGEGPARFLEAA